MYIFVQDNETIFNQKCCRMWYTSMWFVTRCVDTDQGYRYESENIRDYGSSYVSLL